MADIVHSWIIPFTFIPGVAMLVMSTSNRFHYINSLIRSLSPEYKETHKEEVSNLLRRSRYFHNTLIFLYFSVAFLSVSALSGYFSLNWLHDQKLYIYITDGLMLAGVFCLVMAAVQLIRESFLAFRMIRTHLPGS